MLLKLNFIDPFYLCESYEIWTSRKYLKSTFLLVEHGKKINNVLDYFIKSKKIKAIKWFDTILKLHELLILMPRQGINFKLLP